MASGPRRADACLIDIDGTLYQAGRPFPGAADALAALRAAGVPFRLATNTTRRPRAAIVERLAGLGLEVEPEECLTAPMAAVELLRQRGARRVLALLPAATREEFGEFEHDPEGPEYVVVGDLGEEWDYGVLNRAFRALKAGARLLATQRNRFWETAEGLALDAGAFVAALEYASGQQAELTGKPSPAFYRAAAARLGLPAGRIAMVGDDLEADVMGAREAGLLAVAVRTGKFGEFDPALARRADAVLDSVADLPRWLGL